MTRAGCTLTHISHRSVMSLSLLIGLSRIQFQAPVCINICSVIACRSVHKFTQLLNTSPSKMSAGLPLKIVIIGAGVNGLACAVTIQERYPEARLVIISDKFSPDTTSEGSAGFWRPFVAGNTDPGVLLKHSKITHDYLLELAYSPLAGEIGVQLLSGYYLSADGIETPEDDIVRSVTSGYRLLTPKELERFPMAKTGYFHTTLQVDVTPYMEWLMKRFIEKGGVVQSRKLTSLNEFVGQCDLVVNCSGLGSRDLLKDDQMVPTRGQLWRVHAPWIKHFYMFKPKPGQDYTYILPGVANIVVGGTAQSGDWRTTIDETDSVSIWSRACNLLPQMTKATPIRAWAGLRPSRSTLRLESEMMDIDGKKLKVVHNYGHGGSGITLHWGCALEVTKLVIESLGYPGCSVQQTKSRI